MRELDRLTRITDCTKIVSTTLFANEPNHVLNSKQENVREILLYFLLVLEFSKTKSRLRCHCSWRPTVKFRITKMRSFSCVLKIDLNCFYPCVE